MVNGLVKMRHRSALILVFIPLFAIGYAISILSNSSDGPSDGHVVYGTGTIVFLSFEGGFYGIVSDDGKHYDPINLDGAFQVDGLRVRFKARIMEGWLSFHMWGEIVSVVTIERLA